MPDIASVMAMLRHGDSFFPSGAVSFSWGLESLVERGRVTSFADVSGFISGQLHGRWASFDLPVVMAAHRACRDLAALAVIDELVEVHICVAELRLASRRLGDAMLAVFGRLGLEGATAYRLQVKNGQAHCHLSAMQGFLWASSGHDETAALVLSAHTFCTGLVGAAIRLGCLGHFDAQRILSGIAAEVRDIASRPIPPLERLSSCTVEAEIAIIWNASQEGRLFAT